MSSPRAQRLATVTGGAVVALVLAGGAAVGGFATTDALRSPDRPASRSVPPVPRAIASALAAPRTPSASRTPAIPGPAALAQALTPLLGAPALGSRVGVEVQDAATGKVLFSRGATAGIAPASTAKVLVATAILTVHRATDRFTTRVVRGPGADVTLVGAGDPTLTCAAAGRPAAYSGAARISDLAAQLRRAGITPARVVVDDALFTGPAVSPGWAAEDVPSSYAAPETALMCDGGRDTPTDPIRSTAPDLAAGRALAAALGRPSTPVVRGAAPVNGMTVAQVRSASIGTMVTEMLQESDNVIAETLGRQVALARGEPASFTGAVAAVRSVLSTLGVRVAAGMRDASGLAAADRLTARAVASVMTLIADGKRPQLRSVLASLPVAAWSGTLTDRYVTGVSAAAAGLVRAKTGTLTGVSGLAGVVHDRAGRLLSFAVLADRTGDTPDAEAAADALTARLAACGCP